ncbi:iron ABC transporter permease [Thalassotalea ponticola]|uniref:FecCD family ABC transporter permease n=1 Tax=Thalassotalea ponticola TaxID=1523392 RepID=UPI0025B40FB8|nr:iron ABC transporter permease [Thalassotalea ponticola]MDN3652213.1 iron ABC transporter permease [Thalassotalea ponticola]
MTETSRPQLRGNLYLLVISIAVILISIVAALGLGSSDVSYRQLWQCIDACETPLYHTIFFELRLPRILTGFIVGAGLAVAGSLLQNATRNPLADPYLFGIVAGAGLGATVTNLIDLQHWPVATQALVLPIAAFIGALVAIGLVLSVLNRYNLHRSEHVLLAGVAISFLLSAITSFILYTGDAFAANRVIFWLMGSLAQANSHSVYVLLPIVAVSILLSLLMSKQLDALLLGDDSAKTVGVDAQKLRIAVLVLCALMCAMIVAFCGGIGFVGLMIPHVVRRLFSLTSFKLIIFSALVGGVFLVWVDVLARTLLDGQELPIGVITSLLGSLFFLTLMRHTK